VIGASAGGIRAIKRIVADLPRDLPASIFVATHIPPGNKSILPNILNKAGKLPARHAVDREKIRMGQIYIALPGHHLIIEKGQARVTSGPAEGGFRPAIDALFRSAARSYGSQVIGLILTGLLDDGTAGLLSVKRHGGVAIVQDPDDAAHPDMPRNALAHVDVDYCLPISEIAATLTNLVIDRAGKVISTIRAGTTTLRTSEAEVADLRQETGVGDRIHLNLREMDPGEASEDPAPVACPACGGGSLELQRGNQLQFECKAGHRYSAESLIAAQTDDVERALWMALRLVEKHGAFARRMAKHWRALESEQIAREFDKKAVEAEENVNVLRQVLGRGGVPVNTGRSGISVQGA
jgi:two-component system chemotaxis response regulator CheB